MPEDTARRLDEIRKAHAEGATEGWVDADGSPRGVVGFLLDVIDALTADVERLGGPFGELAVADYLIDKQKSEIIVLTHERDSLTTLLHQMEAAFDADTVHAVEVNAALTAERDDAVARCMFVIGLSGWSEEGTFTFPDGDTWRRSDD